jgi:LmbE family N-acetylglucosaminyl deacetylase
VVFLGHVDGELDSTLEVRSQVARVIRELRPQVVLGHDPWKRYRLHPDHRHAGLLEQRAGALVQLDGVVAADLFAVDVRSIGRRVAQCQDALA